MLKTGSASVFRLTTTLKAAKCGHRLTATAPIMRMPMLSNSSVRVGPLAKTGG